MNLSVIIPTRNRSDLLKSTLLSISCQNFTQNDFEVLVIDNGSTDNTKEIVNSFKDKIQNLKCFYEPAPGLHVGRHKGLKEASADIIVYADDDIEAFPTWLEGIWESFQDGKVALVGGNNLPKYETSPPIWVESLWSYNQYGKHNGYYSLIDFGDVQKEIDPYFVFGCNFSIRKSTLLEFGGFHPDAMPREKIKYRGDGESYISAQILKKGYKTVFNPKASVFHYVPSARMSKDYLYHRGFIQGISNSYSAIRGNELERAKPQKDEEPQSLKAPPSFISKAMDRFSGREFKRDINSLRLEVREGFDNYKRNLNLNEYLTATQIGFQDGFAYHQNELKNDQELFKWVVKDNYL